MRKNTWTSWMLAAVLLRVFSLSFLAIHIEGAVPLRQDSSVLLSRIQVHDAATTHYRLSFQVPVVGSLEEALALPRGGASQVDDDEDGSDYYDEDDETTAMEVSMDFTMDSLVDAGKKVVSQTVQVASWIFKAVARSVEAGFDESDEEADLPTVARLTKAIQRMVQGLFSSSSSKEEPLLQAKTKAPTKKKSKSSKSSNSKSKKKKAKKAKKAALKEEEETKLVDTSEDTLPVVDEDEDTVETSQEKQSTDESPSNIMDFGKYLEKAYSVTEASRNELEEPCTIHSGSFSNAMSHAQSEARLLLVLIPSQKPSAKSETDLTAIQSFLSQEVAVMADRKALKGGLKMGSFHLWTALPGSTEASQALKRLKLSLKNPQGTKRPVLAAVYVGMDSRGRLVPKLLAQHHASPPPAPEMMAAWMNALRKRHKAQFSKMQSNVRELELYKERQEGYKSSMVQDTENRQKEAELAAEAKRKADQEAQHQAEIQKRRTQLAEELGDEVPNDTPNSKVLSIRMDSGESCRRRFAHDATIEMVLNWADVQCQVEREKVVLTTLNGKHTFSWDNLRDATLEEVGLGKMTAFRLGISKETEPEGEEEEDKS